MEGTVVHSIVICSSLNLKYPVHNVHSVHKNIERMEGTIVHSIVICYSLNLKYPVHSVHSVHKNIERMLCTVVHSIVICYSLNLKYKSCSKEFSLCHKLLFYNPYFFAKSLSFDISNFELCLHYQVAKI